MNSEQLKKEVEVLGILGRIVGYWRAPGNITPDISKLAIGSDINPLPNKNKIVDDLKHWNLTTLVLTTTNSKVNLISVKGHVSSSQQHTSLVFMDGVPGNYHTKFQIEIILNSKKSVVICRAVDSGNEEVVKCTYDYDEVRARNTGYTLSEDFESIITQFIKEYDL